MHIGIAGIGKMGAAIAARLIDNGHRIAVWNRTAAKAEALAALGARIESTPRALAAACDVIIATLSDASVFDAVYHGVDGLLAGEVRGKIFIDLATIRPADARALAARVRAAGAAFVECPVSGSTGPAREGKLFALVGAEPEDFARVRPILEGLCRRIEHLGPVGAGASMKLAINLPLLVYYQALGEALALAKPLGLAPERLVDMLCDTSGTPAMMKNRAPSVVKQLQGISVPPTVDVANVCKDLRTMLEEAQVRGGDSPLVRAALESYRAELDAGFGSADCTKLAALWFERAPASPPQVAR